MTHRFEISEVIQKTNAYYCGLYDYITQVYPTYTYLIVKPLDFKSPQIYIHSTVIDAIRENPDAFFLATQYYFDESTMVKLTYDGYLSFLRDKKLIQLGI